MLSRIIYTILFFLLQLTLLFSLSSCLLKKEEEAPSLLNQSTYAYNKKEFRDFLENDIIEKTRVIQEFFNKANAAQLYFIEQDDIDDQQVQASNKNEFYAFVKRFRQENKRIPFTSFYEELFSLEQGDLSIDTATQDFSISSNVIFKKTQNDQSLLQINMAIILSVTGHYFKKIGERMRPYDYQVKINGIPILNYTSNKSDSEISSLHVISFLNLFLSLLDIPELKKMLRQVNYNIAQELPIMLIHKNNKYTLDLSFIKESDGKIAEIKGAPFAYKKMTDSKTHFPYLIFYSKSHEGKLAPFYLITETKFAPIHPFIETHTFIIDSKEKNELREINNGYENNFFLFKEEYPLDNNSKMSRTIYCDEKFYSYPDEDIPASCYPIILYKEYTGYRAEKSKLINDVIEQVIY